MNDSLEPIHQLELPPDADEPPEVALSPAGGLVTNTGLCRGKDGRLSTCIDVFGLPIGPPYTENRHDSCSLYFWRSFAAPTARGVGVFTQCGDSTRIQLVTESDPAQRGAR